jgi:hypothetical protein
VGVAYCPFRLLASLVGPSRLAGFCEPEEKFIKFWPTLAPDQLESIAGIVVAFFVFRCSRDALQLNVLLVALFWGSHP